MSSPALQTQLLSKRYRRVWALRDCSLTVAPGRVVALVGPNGAGKTTLLHAAAGLLTPTSGTVRVFAEVPGTPPALSTVAFVAQDKPLYDSFTVAQLVRMARGLNRQWDRALAARRLAALEIPLRRRAGRLSGGQQSQVAFTLAVAKRPRLLLLDEPLANLDPLARTDFMRELMGTVAANGTTVVLSSHAISDLVGTCDWLVVLNRGQVQVSGDIDELLGAHHALSGPAADRLPDTVAVITRTESGRQAHHLVRGTAPVADPRWTSRPVGLEELVLGYLREPDAAALPGPALTTIEGGG